MIGELRLKNIDENVIERLKSKARQKGMDLNSFIISLFKKELEEKPPQDGLHDDLTYLAGTWTEEDEQEFLNATEPFNQVDDEL